jgi:hypothetical protein
MFLNTVIVEAHLARGMSTDEFAPNLSFFFYGLDAVGLEYADVACDQLFFAVAHCCQAATWYSFMRPPTICFRRTRCSARSICSGQA